MNTIIKEILSKEIFKQIDEKAKFFLKNQDGAHDYSHAIRVLTNAIKIAQTEGGDIEILTATALLHDIVNVPKNHPERHLSSAKSAEQAEEILLELGFDKNKIPTVKDAVLNHSFSRGQIPKTLEGKIFQDADRLDGIGAIGIARTYATGASFKAKLYCNTDPFLKSNRVPDDKHNTLDHFSVKLLKLQDMMLTKTGKQLAQKRTQFMLDFIENLKSEIS